MISSSRTLVPALVLTAMVAANGATSPPARPEPEVTGTAAERPAPAKAVLRPSQEPVAPEKRPVRVILPSPYSER